jgi:hypothetical protein
MAEKRLAILAAPIFCRRLRLALPALVFFHYCSDLSMPSTVSAIKQFIFNVSETPFSWFVEVIVEKGVRESRVVSRRLAHDGRDVSQLAVGKEEVEVGMAQEFGTRRRDYDCC